MTSPRLVSRRRFVQLAGAAAGLAALHPVEVLARPGENQGRKPTPTPGPSPTPTPPPSGLIDPYGGALADFAWPLAPGALGTLANNWHAARQGAQYDWSHRNSKTRRAHDGADIYPVADQSLPGVVSPVAGTVAAICRRSDNTLGADVDYQVDGSGPPPWDYSAATDTVDDLPLYGDFVWIRREDGYYVFLCHLATGSIPEAIVAGATVGVGAPLGVMGDTGNAVGAPQLHVEIHYPAGSTFGCSRCRGPVALTAINPYPTLLAAVPTP